MDDYISRQASINAIGNIPDYEDGMVFEALSHAQRDVALLPPADVQPVRHGQWIGISYDGYADGNPVFCEWKCSECGKIVVADDANELNYCCNCGARMDGEQNG